VDDLVKAMAMTGISKNQVSRHCSEIDGRVYAFPKPAAGSEWPDLWLDATYLKVRRSGRIVSVAAVVAAAVNTDGMRGPIGIAVMPAK
jgi:putative transposase